MTDLQQGTARFTSDASAVLIEKLAIRDRDVVREAQRWTAGERGPAVDSADELARADLTAFATEAIRLGAHALTVTGQARESQALGHMLKEVGDRTLKSTAEATEATQRAANEAADAMSKAVRDAKQAITEADDRSRKEFTNAVDTAKQSLHTELQRLFCGERPDVLERLKPVLDSFGRELDAKAKAGTTELVDKVVKQFDADDPNSPMAKHVKQLSTRQSELVERLNEQHKTLNAKLDELATAVKVREATTSLANVTPLKGDSYADRVHRLMREIASGLGDDYDDTSVSAGKVSRSKKGDGVLTLNGGTLRIVLEVTDSERRGWSAYLDEAERNRDAVASLGLVRSPEQNGGQSIRVIGPQRLVVAFDPGVDDPELLRTIVQLLRTVAIATVARKGTEEIATAEEKIEAALAHLGQIDVVKKASSAIQKNAAKIDSECATLGSGIRRLLDEALAALSGADSDRERGPDVESNVA